MIKEHSTSSHLRPSHLYSATNWHRGGGGVGVIFSLQDQYDGFVDIYHTILYQLVGLQNSSLFLCTDQSDCLAQFPFRERFYKV